MKMQNECLLDFCDMEIDINFSEPQLSYLKTGMICQGFIRAKKGKPKASAWFSLNIDDVHIVFPSL